MPGCGGEHRLRLDDLRIQRHENFRNMFCYCFLFISKVLLAQVAPRKNAPIIKAFPFMVLTQDYR